MAKTVIIGASPNPSRYSNKAGNRLLEKGHEILPLGIKEGSIDGYSILTEPPEQVKEVDTVTLYLNPAKQQEWYDYILGLAPRRIIFNPGAENPELKQMAEANNIETVEGCTLVMLASGTF